LICKAAKLLELLFSTSFQCKKNIYNAIARGFKPGSFIISTSLLVINPYLVATPDLGYNLNGFYLVKAKAENNSITSRKDGADQLQVEIILSTFKHAECTSLIPM